MECTLTGGSLTNSCQIDHCTRTYRHCSTLGMSGMQRGLKVNTPIVSFSYVLYLHIKMDEIAPEYDVVVLGTGKPHDVL